MIDTLFGLGQSAFSTLAFVSPFQCLFGFFSSLLLPVIMLAILAAAMGGNAANIAEGLADTLSSCAVIFLDLILRLFRTFFLASIYVASALARTILSWQMSRVTLKTGPEPDDAPPANKTKDSPN